MTWEGIEFKLPAVYILESKDQDEGVEGMVQRREMTKTAAASQKIERQPLVFEAVRAAAIFVAHVCEIWGKPICLWVRHTYTLEMYVGVHK